MRSIIEYIKKQDNKTKDKIAKQLAFIFVVVIVFAYFAVFNIPNIYANQAKQQLANISSAKSFSNAITDAVEKSDIINVLEQTKLYMQRNESISEQLPKQDVPDEVLQKAIENFFEEYDATSTQEQEKSNINY